MLGFLANTGISISSLIPLGALVLWEEDEGEGLGQPGEEAAAEAPNSSPQYLQGGQQGDRARSFIVVHSRKTRGGGLRSKKGEVQSSYKEKLEKKKSLWR